MSLPSDAAAGRGQEEAVKLSTAAAAAAAAASPVSSCHLSLPFRNQQEFLARAQIVVDKGGRP